MEVGQPSVWSLSQAHYLLTQMHQINRNLSIKLPSSDQLDPNKANASRLEILRTLLQVDASFDQSVGLKNRIELQKFGEKEERRVQAQILLRERQAALQQLDQELLDLNQQLAVLTVQDDLAKEARKDAPPSDADRQRKEKIASLKVLIEAKQAQRAALQTEITNLNTTINTDVEAPNVTPGSPPTSNATMGSTTTPPAAAGGTDSTALKDFTAKALSSFGTPPTVAASVALDNYLGMQYEIIAKQLTLLRDEAGPDERIIFLELPTSIYTVDRWANGLIAQVSWKVTRIYDEKPSDKEVICKGLKSIGRTYPQIAETIEPTWRDVRTFAQKPDQHTCLYELYEKVLKDTLRDMKGGGDLEKQRFVDQSLDDPIQALRARDDEYHKLTPAGELCETRLKEFMEEWERIYSAYQERLHASNEPEYPVTLEMIANSPTSQSSPPWPQDPAGLGWKPFRTIDIIPRQSALNINEYQATTNNTGILGVLKLLSGFGAQVNFQRQREVYEGLLQQEVYASGFGKGTEDFGWTFGPLPGSKRIAPGQRTTYAVLAVPRSAQAIQIEGTGRAFPGDAYPQESDKIVRAHFLIRVPSESTDRFWVDSATYTPVSKNQAVTVLIQGSNFSPQLGVLVNGISLNKSLSITRVGSISEAEAVFPDSGIHGEFELANSRDLILRFSMGKEFVGTPNITLVAPERTTNINTLPMKVNFRSDSLANASIREPMFSDEFKVEEKLEKASHESIGSGAKDYEDIQKMLKSCAKVEGFEFYRINGSGLRPKAEIAINDITLELTSLAELSKMIKGGRCQELASQSRAIQESTHSYLLYFKEPETSKWKVRYRQPTRQSFDESRFEHAPAIADFKSEVRHYQFNRSAKVGEVDLTLSFPKNLVDKQLPRVCFNVPGKDPKRCTDVRKDQDGKFRVHCDVPADQGERDFVSFEVQAELKTQVKDEECPEKTVEKIETKPWLFDLRFPVRPLLTKLEPRPLTKPAKAVLTGENLHRVTGVLFGNQVAEMDLKTSRLPTQLDVKIPPLEVPAGQKEEVPVTFQTDEGAIPTGINFEYSGPPAPKKAEEASAKKG